jgi:hypothetical protein
MASSSILFRFSKPKKEEIGENAVTLNLVQFDHKAFYFATFKLTNTYKRTNNLLFFLLSYHIGSLTKEQ